MAYNLETLATDDIYTVSRLNFEARALLEGHFPSIMVEGELSNISNPSSGHLYFTLKDRRAQVRCAMFKSRNRLLAFRPEDGLQVILQATLSVYEARGDYQLNVYAMHEAGSGQLRREFEKLKNQLQQQGWFAEDHKKSLPYMPTTVGVISSISGAAIHDILTTLKKRFAPIRVIIYPVLVQGSAAADRIAAAIQQADNRQECEVLIIARGGGSLEDLWSFNQIAVAQAVYNCSLPIVSGVGHESDITITDLVADVRAATPTAAAQMVSPDQTAVLDNLTKLRRALDNHARNFLHFKHSQLSLLSAQLINPKLKLEQYSQRIDELELRLQYINRLMENHDLKLKSLYERLQRQQPQTKIVAYQKILIDLHSRIVLAGNNNFDKTNLQLQNMQSHLLALNPLSVLARGYAIVYKNGKIVKKAVSLNADEVVDIHLHQGKIKAQVR